MNSKRTYIYNVVLRENDVCPQGELLTDKELERMKQHCLWAHDEQKQIDKMRELYDLLPVKPEWLTREQIDEYAARMGIK